MATKKETKKNTVKISKTITGMNFRDEIILIYIIPFIALVFAFMKDRLVEDKTRFHYNQAATSAIFMLIFAAICKVPFIGFLGYIGTGVLIVFNIITLVKEIKENISYEIPLISKISETIFK